MDLMPAVRRAVTRQRGKAEQAMWMLALFVVPTLLRASVDTGGLALPFLTFWPSLLVASLILDTGFAIAFAVVAAAGAQRIFGGGGWFVSLDAARIVFFALFAFSASLIIAMGTLLRRAVRHLEQANQQQEGFNRELRHRVRNMLAIVQALASSGPKAENPLDFFREFSGRLDSLARASDLLRIGTEAEGRLPDLIERTVEPFSGTGRIHLQGTPCVVPDESCIPLIMALHELCTNAVKHGALSGEAGRVEISWFVAEGGGGLFLLWKEVGGPTVRPPQRTGIGTRLLMPQPGLDRVELAFEPRGLWCEIAIHGGRHL
ncbi:sensor histidine kinase [Novosphingobium cyanobacteriorum]|uniref:histidine kinase n=1 Tax=Novosphingobium cyanobacteriorum TaxID=3024215 RepID=A0ABT6CMQ0_9SPHN|nr:sensor histidine kinase [Novosphingobium cyanobacteriorum]MDF8335199.1 sensor histidine kinase [Novosphingobium cyanobacteriorum]